MIKAKKLIPDRPGYFDKYLDARFRHIDETSSKIEKTMCRIEEKIETENRITREENKEENRTTRKWLVTTAISLMVGFTAIAVSIFFGFAKLQTSWIQTVISFVGKTVVK